MSNVSLVVMEKGSDWPGHVAAIEDVVAVSQDDAGLLVRTQEKVAALESSSRSVRLAVLTCNQTSGAEATRRRTLVARALLGAVSRATFGRLVLSASAFASPSLRRELLALAGDLTGALGRSSTTISLQFTNPRPRVGLEPGGRRPMAVAGSRP